MKIIQLTNFDNDSSIYVVAENIILFEEENSNFNQSKSTLIRMCDTGRNLHVKETPEQIIGFIGT